METGKFRIYETKEVQGEESYEITRAPGSRNRLIVKAKLDLPFWGEEKKPSLTATLRMDDDLTPTSFEIKGIRPLEVDINTSVDVRGRTALVREGQHVKRVAVPDKFFTYGGYVPVTMEMMLVRYWLKHDLGARKTALKLLPHGEGFIEHRGRDIVAVAGKQIPLDRYHLSGSGWGGGWGRQTLWFDSEQQLIAVTNIGSDVETGFSAVRDGYESALPFFVKRTAEDGVERLTQMADSLSPKRTGALVLLGGALIDGSGRAPVPDSVVVIEGTRITAVGRRGQVSIPEGAMIIDAKGKYLLPGLWDMHAHLYQIEIGTAYLAAGITTARDVGNEIEFATTLRDAERQGRGLGPMMLLAGYIDGKNDGHSFDVQVDTPADARAAVQRYKNAGYEQIKIRDHVKPEILKVITAEAHRLGMTVTGHVPEGMNSVQAVEAGMDQIAHLNFVATGFLPNEGPGKFPAGSDLVSSDSKHALQVFKDHGTVIDPTMAVFELMLRPKNMRIETFEPGMKKIAPELIEQLEKKGSPPQAAPMIRRAIDAMLALIGLIHKEGIPIVAGTDVGVPGHTLHRELELYVKAGMTPMEAIQAATLVPSRVMKLENEVGTIAAGKRADIIILDANPLENISNIRKVKLVVTRGRLFDSASLAQSVGFKH
jgi:imidazolonepropionase-like amidohydrolase